MRVIISENVLEKSKDMDIDTCEIKWNKKPTTANVKARKNDSHKIDRDTYENKSMQKKELRKITQMIIQLQPRVREFSLCSIVQRDQKWKMTMKIYLC